MIQEEQKANSVAALCVGQELQALEAGRPGLTLALPAIFSPVVPGRLRIPLGASVSSPVQGEQSWQVSRKAVVKKTM